MHAKFACFVRGCRDHAPLVRLPTDHDRFRFQRRVEQLLHRDKECVHVNVKNGSRRGQHGPSPERKFEYVSSVVCFFEKTDPGGHRVRRRRTERALRKTFIPESVARAAAARAHKPECTPARPISTKNLCSCHFASASATMWDRETPATLDVWCAAGHRRYIQ